MNSSILEQFQDRLSKREEEGSLRTLILQNDLIDFASNDYLGLARTADKQNHDNYSQGSTGSRLLTGNSKYHQDLEEFLAENFKGAAALLFGSGYDANIGLFSALPTRHDFVLYDELCHASIRDGINLSLAKSYSFKHNDLDDLNRLVDICRGRNPKAQIFVAIQSIYSMEGDLAPLPALTKLSTKLGLDLIIDEAHTTGVFGERGEGMVVEAGLQSEFLARIYTFGKALGVHGGVVVGPRVLINYLINFSRPFIYSTAPSIHSVKSIESAVRQSIDAGTRRDDLQDRWRYYCEKVQELGLKRSSCNNSPIQWWGPFEDNFSAREIALKVQKKGFDVRAILPPTVPAGGQRIRINLHSFNKENEIDQLLKSLKEVS